MDLDGNGIQTVKFSETGHGALDHALSVPVSGNTTLFTQQFMQCMGSRLVYSSNCFGGL